MRRLIIVSVSLSLSLTGAAGIALAQENSVAGLVTNADGANVRSTAGVNPTANGEGGTVIYGDITTGSGYTVVGPPSASASDPAPVAAANDAATQPEPVVADSTDVSSADRDGDNYADALEPDLGLDPNSVDTDSDAVADGDELNIYGTDPLNADSDEDGVIDGSELFDTRTDPLVWTDFASDSGEQTVAQAPSGEIVQTAPADAALTQTAVLSPKELALQQQGTTEILTAVDGNASALGTGDATAAPGTVTRNGVTVPSILGLDGTYSVNEISPPTVDVSGDASAVEPAPEAAAEPAPEAAPVADASSAPEESAPAEAAPAEAPAADTTDLDGDNYPDAREIELGLDPTNIDTDADGVADGDELNIYGTDPFTADSDGDGVTDGGELYDTRTDPLVWTDFSAEPATQTVEQDSTVQDGM